MPSEYTVIPEESPLDIVPQVKLCSQCHCAVDANIVFLPDAGSLVTCAGCQNQFPAFTTPQRPAASPDSFPTSIAPDYTLSTPISPARRNLYDHVKVELDSSIPLLSDPTSNDFLCCNPVDASPSYTSKPAVINITHAPPRVTTLSTGYSDVRGKSFIAPSPLTDITRLRVRSQGNHCLYPGAVFQGTQKSGRSSYDVNVTIVDVDFANSSLCGYLRIRGLTEDWPDLTTYFDAEIIGSRYGFLTENWGANEQQDLVHWQRFPAFKHVKNEMKKPHLTISDRDRGAVFMRWKEKFLVPDHRVQDICGASFAGFYYVCVDFNPSHNSKSCEVMPLTEETGELAGDGSEVPVHEEPTASSPLPIKQESYRRTRRSSSSRRRGGRSPSTGPRQGAPVASMSGFYFHQNSEPYQQLSLSHIPERATSSFEFR
ncbi:hypothetical protein GYMLUDRAFT_45853 [Collybiopsis luxurians FD-317 M1]|uniref:Vacuolar import and degradation protein n=1 Tax=Collybiopsis luxurians FD-317 M1 TaxID=944289 RepID=A0A0D0CHG3_9AGAR|nr:hypothetical protein GYMLUDRAFT_45853 [Collybiopsis luxurians FD-317 M1]